MEHKFTSKNYINIQGWMITDFKLKGNELLLYALIHGFSQNGSSVYDGSIKYLTTALNCSKNTVSKSLNGLVSNKFIIKEVVYVNNVRFCKYWVCQDKIGGIAETAIGGRSETASGGIAETDHNSKPLYNKRETRSEKDSDKHTNKQNDGDWASTAKDWSKDKQPINKTTDHSDNPFEVLRSDNPMMYEQRIGIKYHRLLNSLKLDEKKRLIERFNNQYIMEEREFKPTIIAARLSNYIDSWLNNVKKSKDKPKGKL